MIFIPKPEAKGFRPISVTSTMCRLYERLVQRRLEYLAERKDWIHSFQFGFRTVRSAMDCVATVTADILQGFGTGKSTLAFAIDIKDAFNSILPNFLIDNIM